MAQSPLESANTSSGRYIKQSMYSNTKFYEKDYELHEIHFPGNYGAKRE